LRQPPETLDGWGIVRVVTYRAGKGDEHWEANFAKSRELLSESGVEFVELARE
jgi:hypothetical protein